jgi:hypothetical protein
LITSFFFKKKTLPRENIDAQAASTDGRAMLYANDQTHIVDYCGGLGPNPPDGMGGRDAGG